MQNDKQSTKLGSLLETLEASDVAPQWQLADAWQRLEPSLLQPTRKQVPLYYYPAATAVLLILLLLLQPRPPKDLASKTAPASPSIAGQTHFKPEPTATLPTASTNTNGIARHPQQTLLHTSAAPAVRNKETVPAGPQDLVVNVPSNYNLVSEAHSGITAIPETTTDSNLSSPPDYKTFKRSAPVVYTINEILSDLPEREAPPRQFSGIFRQHPRVVETHWPERSRQRLSQPLEDPAPIIIP